MNRPSPPVRLGLAACCLLAVLAGAGPLVAADAASSAFVQVEVDLEGGFADQVLPFDEPFILTGRAPAGVQRLEVRCWELETCRQRPEHPACAGKAKTATILPDPKRHPDGDCPTWTEPFPVWINRVDPQEANPTFSVLAPMLEAEKYYALGFRWDRKPSPDEAAAFAAEVSATLDAALWSASPRSGPLPATGDLADDDLAAVRTQVIDSLLAVTGADRVQDCSGTEVLCPDVALDEVRDDFNQLLLPVRNAQSQIESQIENYKSEVDTVNLQLARIRSDGGLAAFAAALEGAAAATPTLADEAAQVRGALALADLPDLRAADRASPQALADFARSAARAVDAAAQEIGALRGLLVDGAGNPTPLLRQLSQPTGSEPGALGADAAAELQALAAPRGLVGSTDRALARLQGYLSAIQGELADRRTARQAVAAEFATRAQEMVLLAASTQPDFVTAQRNYLSGDAGIVWAPELEDFSSYVGTNIYARPINKSASISQFGNFWQTLDRRVSLTLGLTVGGVGDDATRDDLFSNQSLVLGVGARMSGSLRLMVGALVFKELDPNPLVDDETIAVTPFLSLSFDVDVVPALTGLGNAFQTGN